MKKILVTGAGGQLGSELTPALIDRFGGQNVIPSDIRESLPQYEIYEQVDVLDKKHLTELIKKHQITEIYHLAAVLSARAESDPLGAWDINMRSLLNILELSVELGIKKVYWPSSIAAFGPNSPRDQTPQHTTMDPSTVYGISKLAGERWLEYYWKKYGLDCRSLRYPGIISHKTLPGGGTTDYAVDIFVKANRKEHFNCFLSEKTALPMMFIDDAVRGTIELMEAEASRVKVRSSYNLSAISFTPEELYAEIVKQRPDFKISYAPDFRQKIADSWPKSIDDSAAREDWGWKHQFDLNKMVQVMLDNIQ